MPPSAPDIPAAIPPGTRRVQCKSCLAVKDIPDGTDPHAVTWCGCCPLDHHHGRDVLSAQECEAAGHPGQPCWNPPSQPVRPDGCTICRPVIHFAVAGSLL